MRGLEVFTMLVRLGFCGLIMAAVCACNGGVDGAGTSSSSGSGGGGGESTTSGGSTTGGGGSAPSACASAPLCDGVYLPSSCDPFGGSSGAGGASPGVMAAAAMRCVLTKLRDHEVGYMSVFVESHATTGCGIRTEIVSFGDGTASVQDIHWADIGVTPGTPVRATLKDKAYFDACLADSDDKLADCVAGITTGATAAGPTCPCRGVPGAQDGQCKSPF
jgi:hypothetical protein